MLSRNSGVEILLEKHMLNPGLISEKNSPVLRVARGDVSEARKNRSWPEGIGNKGGIGFGHGLSRKTNMKATPSVAKVTAPKPIIPDKARGGPVGESLDLSQESLRVRAFASTQTMDEILEKDDRIYSFRHWGINE